MTHDPGRFHHQAMLPYRERLIQLARLVGVDAFSSRFGPPQTADPTPDAMRSLIDERIEQLAQGLVDEAAASDDVTDASGAASYLDDRLHTLGDFLTADQSDRIRRVFAERTATW